MCWVLLSLQSFATTARLSFASRNEGDAASQERPEPNSECEGQVSTKNGALQDTGRMWSARRVTGNAVLTEVLCESGS